MLVLANFGNGILHPRAISLAKESNIRLHVRSSFSNVEGSVIGPDGDDSVPVKSITCCNKFVYVRICDLSSKAIDVFKSEEDIPFEIAISEVTNNSISIGFPRNQAFEAITYCWEKAAELEAERVECFSELTTISLVGSGFLFNKNLVKEFLDIAENSFCIIKQYDNLRLSIAVTKENLSKILAILHSKLQEINKA